MVKVSGGDAEASLMMEYQSDFSERDKEEDDEKEESTSVERGGHIRGHVRLCSKDLRGCICSSGNLIRRSGTRQKGEFWKERVRRSGC